MGGFLFRTRVIIGQNCLDLFVGKRSMVCKYKLKMKKLAAIAVLIVLLSTSNTHAQDILSNKTIHTEQALARTDLAGQKYIAKVLIDTEEIITLSGTKTKTVQTVNVNGTPIPFADGLKPEEALDLLEGRSDSIVRNSPNYIQRSMIEWVLFWKRPVRITKQIFKVAPGAVAVEQTRVIITDTWDYSPTGTIIGFLVITTIIGWSLVSYQYVKNKKLT